MATKKTKDTSADEPKKTKGAKADVRPAKAAAPAPKPAPEKVDEGADDEPERDEAERGETDEAGGDDRLVAAGGESAALEPAEADAAAREGGEAEGEQAATALGSQRYVMAGFFAAGMIAAFVLGKVLHGVWASASNKDWFSRSVPALAAVTDDDKTTYSMLAGAVIAVVLVVRQYRKPDVRAWTDEVAAELAKVKWPTKKDVSNSTIVVIAASTVATVYLALLDRLWAFVTNLVYGTGT